MLDTITIVHVSYSIVDSHLTKLVITLPLTIHSLSNRKNGTLIFCRCTGELRAEGQFMCDCLNSSNVRTVFSVFKQMWRELINLCYAVTLSPDGPAWDAFTNNASQRSTVIHDSFVECKTE